MRIGAVIVAYHPEQSTLQSLIDVLTASVDELVIIDNSNNKHATLANQSPITYMHFPENIGIARAQNVGLRHIKERNCEYALLFDQDSRLAPDFVPRLQQAFTDTQQQIDSLVAIGPQVICDFNNRPVRPKVQKYIKQCGDVFIVPQIISSGMFIDLSRLDDIGYKDERLFIDGVDHEWCWRAQKEGYCVGLAGSLNMQHKLGDRRASFLGLSYKVGAPVRLYYQFRNILLLSRRSYVPLYWKLRCLSLLPLRFILNALFQAPRIDRLRFMLKGIKDGVLKRSGAYSTKKQ
ncbi:glycosyltransferase family 2 protein [Glaciecola siphonariae]|uniref:Glycosyltransferase family 2 protein n=1 Tax=Glaciecola siphonariae TaxID=521012 RepID=A0ABV9LUU0_9ALTE